MSLTCLTNVVYLAWKTLMEMVHARVLLSSHTVPKHYFLSKNHKSQKSFIFGHKIQINNLAILNGNWVFRPKICILVQCVCPCLIQVFLKNSPSWSSPTYIGFTITRLLRKWWYFEGTNGLHTMTLQCTSLSLPIFTWLTHTCLWADYRKYYKPWTVFSDCPPICDDFHSGAMMYEGSGYCHLMMCPHQTQCGKEPFLLDKFKNLIVFQNKSLNFWIFKEF